MSVAGDMQKNICSTTMPADIEVSGCADCGRDVTPMEFEVFAKTSDLVDGLRWVVPVAHKHIAFCLCRLCLLYYDQLPVEEVGAYQAAIWRKIHLRLWQVEGAAQ